MARVTLTILRNDLQKTNTFWGVGPPSPSYFPTFPRGALVFSAPSRGLVTPSTGLVAPSKGLVAPSKGPEEGRGKEGDAPTERRGRTGGDARRPQGGAHGRRRRRTAAAARGRRRRSLPPPPP